MEVEDVGVPAVVPARRVDHEPRGVEAAHAVDELALEGFRRRAPVLVEEHPEDDARVAAELRDDLVHLADEARAALLGREVMARRDVLRHEQPEAVAPLVPA